MPAILTRAGHTVEAMRIDDPGEALGINDRAQLALADAIFRERKRSALMAAGVTLIKPETITIDSDVEIGMDTIDDPGEALGINDRAQLALADAIFRERKRSALMAAGVTLIKPETITIDSAVEIGMDTIVEPFAQILGATTIGENCRIGACSIIQDSQLGDAVEIGAFTLVNTSVLEHGVHRSEERRVG